MNLYEVQEYYWTFKTLCSILRVVTTSLNPLAATAVLQTDWWVASSTSKLCAFMDVELKGKCMVKQIN
jgi:hypothetical protein